MKVRGKRQYRKYTKPDCDFGQWSKEEFVAAMPRTETWYREAGGLNLFDQPALEIIASVLYFMTGKVRVVEFRPAYEKDLEGDEQFMDLNAKGRWSYKQARSLAMKRMQLHRFVPKLDEIADLLPDGKKGWAFFQHYLPMAPVQWDTKACQSWESKYLLLEKLAKYSPPSRAGQDENFDECVADEGAGFWLLCETAEELAAYYAQGLDESPKWHAVAREVCRERKWGQRYLTAVNQIRDRRRQPALRTLC
jgi:hypothetical protein